MGEVSRRGRGIARLALLLMLCCAPAQALIITPQTIGLEEYGSAQEVVITIYNDQFEPVGCEMTLDYLSSYLAQYVTFEPSRFIVQPSTQQNVKAELHIPTQMPPQTHKLTILPYADSPQAATITFRPPGTPQPGLALQEVTFEEEQGGRTIIASMEMKNTGNTVLFATPQFLITQEGAIVKNITYPRPIIVREQQTYPLTLRQDNSDLPPAEYVAVVKVLYRAEDQVLGTGEELFTFTILEEAAPEGRKSWWMAAAIAASIGILALFSWWLVKSGAERRQRHARKDAYGALLDEIEATRAELDVLAQQVGVFADEAQQWLAQKGGGL